MLKISNVRVLVGTDEAELPRRVSRLLRIRTEDLSRFRILRKSLDIRDKRRLQHVYTVAVELPDEAHLLSKGHPSGRARIDRYVPTPFREPVPGSLPLDTRPIIVGAGPAGLFCAYQLAERGYAPLLLERGRPVRDRIRDVAQFDAGGEFQPESNYLFGEGGAGTFSDGKLTCRNTGPDTDRVLEIIARSKGKPSVVYEAKPHLGSNRLPAVVKSLRQQIEAMGGEVHFSSRLTDLEIADGQVRAIWVEEERLATDVVVLATGHSARDVYELLLDRGVPIEAKPFQMGVRIEQPQAQVTLAQFGNTPQAALLGPADYTMKVHAAGQDLFTFCMCAGGYIMPSVSEAGFFCTNGMSRSKHESPFANSGLVVTVDPTQIASDPLAGVRLQREIERTAFELAGRDYSCPIQAVPDFLAGRKSVGTLASSYPRGTRNIELTSFLPPEIVATLREGLPRMDASWQGLFLRSATLVGPESRGSCPVRIPRDPLTRQSIGVEGFYPIGEGAGYAGGIVSAAVDGLRTARAIIEQYQPLVRN